jgi:hypothetical protein
LPKQVSADAGYASDANLKGLEEREIDGFVAAGRQKHGTAAPAAGKAKEDSRLAAMAQKIENKGLAIRVGVLAHDRLFPAHPGLRKKDR